MINDIVVPERIEADRTTTEENQHRQMDLLMLASFGAKERTESDWRLLLKSIDPRLELVAIHYNPVARDCSRSVCEGSMSNLVGWKSP